MKKRIPSLILALVLLLAVIPSTPLASAADAPRLDDVIRTPLTADVTAIDGGTVGANYYLTEDVTLSDMLTVTGGTADAPVIIDLNGHVLTIAKSTSELFMIKSSGHLVLNDSRPEATHDDSSLPVGGVITNDKRNGAFFVGGGSLVMNGGTLYRCNSDMQGCVSVYNPDATFTLNGGSIRECSSMIAGAVFALGDFIMNGGSINDCSHTIGGADSVFVNDYATFYANGGTVSACSAYQGTSVRVNGNATITNSSTDGGATVFYGSSGELSCDTSEARVGHLVSFQLIAGEAWEIVADGGQAKKPPDNNVSPGWTTNYYTNNTCNPEYEWVFESGTVGADMTLYANTVLIRYSITYDLGGGTLAVPNPTEYTVWSDAFVLNEPVREGWEFIGWSGTGLVGCENRAVKIERGSYGDRSYSASWRDVGAPSISGIVHGTIYCAAQSFTVTDNSGSATVTVNGVPVTPDASGSFTLHPALGAQTVIATDGAGNSSSPITVTVNDGHTYDWHSENGMYRKKCRFCPDETQAAAIPTLAPTAPNAVCHRQRFTVSVALPSGCTSPALACVFRDKNGAELGSSGGGSGIAMTEKAVESGVFVGEITVPDGADTASLAISITATTADGFTFTSPEKAITVASAHSGGTATCVARALCDVCGEEYGDIDGACHVGGTELHLDRAPSCTEDGYTGDTHCKSCGERLSVGAPIDATGHSDDDRDHICDTPTCKAIISAHSGGTATCVDRALCEWCGEEYGDVDGACHVGGTELYLERAPSCTEDGYTGDTHCKSCGERLSVGAPIDATGHSDDDRDHICDAPTCKAIISAHSGGTATCVDRALCEWCGEEYGEVDGAHGAHSALKHVDALAPTSSSDGNTEYLHCEDCGRYFSDAECKNEISLADTVIARTNDGDEPADKPTDESAGEPATGDGSRMGLWLALLAGGVALLGATELYGRKKRSAK